MPGRRYERREPTHEWSKVRPLLKVATQLQSDIIQYTPQRTEATVCSSDRDSMPQQKGVVLY